MHHLADILDIDFRPRHNSLIRKGDYSFLVANSSTTASSVVGSCTMVVNCQTNSSYRLGLTEDLHNCADALFIEARQHSSYRKCRGLRTRLESSESIYHARYSLSREGVPGLPFVCNKENRL